MTDENEQDNPEAVGGPIEPNITYLVGDDGPEIFVPAPALKVGARNNSSDKSRIREIRKAARMIHDISMEMEPDDDDKPPEMEGDDENKAANGNALKAISETTDELRVANYIVLFGGRDLEGIASPKVNEDGSRGEYFTPDTEFESEHTKAGQLAVDWEHGMKPDAEGPGRDDILGYVDWKTAVKDRFGVWVERVLDRRNKYMQFLEDLIREGLIGNSSEADPAQVQKGADGAILRWPLVRDALTVNPMEPRMITANTLQALKALGVDVPQEPEPTGEAEETGDVSQSDGEGDKAVTIRIIRRTINITR